MSTSVRLRVFAETTAARRAVRRSGYRLEKRPAELLLSAGQVRELRDGLDAALARSEERVRMSISPSYTGVLQIVLEPEDVA